MNRLSLLLIPAMITTCMQAMEIPEQSTAEKQKINPVLQALITNDCAALQAMGTILLQDNEIKEWARHYYDSDYSLEKNAFVDTLLAQKDILFECPSLVDLASQKVAQLQKFNNLDISCLPQDLKERLPLPYANFNLLKNKCTDLTKPEAFFIEGETELCDSRRADEIKMLKRMIDNYIVKHILITDKIAAIFDEVCNQHRQKFGQFAMTYHFLSMLVPTNTLGPIKYSYIDYCHSIARGQLPREYFTLNTDIMKKLLPKKIVPAPVATAVSKQQNSGSCSIL